MRLEAMQIKAARFARKSQLLVLSVATLSIWLYAVASVFAQDNPSEIDIDQIRKELAQLKLGESQAVTEKAVEKKDGMRDQFTVTSQPKEAQQLSSENAKLRSAEDDLLAELQKVSEVPTAKPSAAPVVESRVVAPPTKTAANLQGVPVNESGQLDLEAIRERAVRKADLNAGQGASFDVTKVAETMSTSEAPGIVEKSIQISESAQIENTVNAASSAGSNSDEMVDAFYSSTTVSKTEPDRTASRAAVPERIEADHRAGVAKSQLATLQNKLAASEKARAKLASDLQEARNRLMIAETEVERLSARMDSGLRRSGPAVRAINSPIVAAQPPTAQQVSYLPMKRDQNDMPVATVTVDKANLRAGPNKDDSPLMSISKGARLAVETRKGEWYRVIAPTGVRAWISADMVAFGRDNISSPTRTLSVRGYDEGIDRN